MPFRPEDQKPVVSTLGSRRSGSTDRRSASLGIDVLDCLSRQSPHIRDIISCELQGQISIVPAELPGL